MSSILERALVALLNEEPAKADALFHEFIVERARAIHESMNQGDDAVLNDDWDDEIKSDDHFSADDLAADADADAADADAVEADVEGDAAEADADAADADKDAAEADDLNFGEPDDEELEDDGDVADRLDDLEQKIADLTRELEGKLGDEFADDDNLGADADADLDVDADDDLAAADDLEGDADKLDGEADADRDAAADLDADADADFAADDDEVDGFGEAADFPAGDDDDDLEDITESVIAELDRIAAPSNADGKLVGAGGSTTPNSDSPLPRNSVNRRQGGKPVEIKFEKNDSFERETAPSVKPMKKRQNTFTGKVVTPRVPAGGDKSALLHKDFASAPKDGGPSPVAKR